MGNNQPVHLPMSLRIAARSLRITSNTRASGRYQVPDLRSEDYVHGSCASTILFRRYQPCRERPFSWWHDPTTLTWLCGHHVQRSDRSALHCVPSSFDSKHIIYKVSMGSTSLKMLNPWISCLLLIPKSVNKTRKPLLGGCLLCGLTTVPLLLQHGLQVNLSQPNE